LDEPSSAAQRTTAASRHLKRLRDIGNTCWSWSTTRRRSGGGLCRRPRAGRPASRRPHRRVGTPDEIIANPDSLTGVISRCARDPDPGHRRKGSGTSSRSTTRASTPEGHGGEIPLGTFTCVTGVRARQVDPRQRHPSTGLSPRWLHRAQDRPGAHDRIEGASGSTRSSTSTSRRSGALALEPGPTPRVHFIRRFWARRARMRATARAVLLQRQGRRCEACRRGAREDRDALLRTSY